MEREERIRHQKEFLIKFAYWAVWGGLVLAAVKLIGPVLLPFIAAFFVAWILSFPVVFVTERMHIRRGIAAVAVVLLFYGLAGLLVGFLGNRIVLLGQELLVDGRPDRRDGGRGGAAHGGHGVGGGGQPGGGTSDRNVRHPVAAGLRHCGKYSGDVL